LAKGSVIGAHQTIERGLFSRLTCADGMVLRHHGYPKK
jgi:hypothetical protein